MNLAKIWRRHAIFNIKRKSSNRSFIMAKARETKSDGEIDIFILFSVK